MAGLRGSMNPVLNAAGSRVGDRLFGMDSDEVLSYATSKVVWVRNRQVGVCYYSMFFLVILWIIGGQILWRNEHFMRKDVTGLPRIWYAQPTVNNCDPTQASCANNFKNKAELPYCAGYEGSWPSSQQADCEYKDRLALVPDGVTDNKLFIPTAVEVISESRRCKGGANNTADCEMEYVASEGSDCLQNGFLCKSRMGRDQQFYYVADVKSFHVRLTSSYERGEIRGNSLQLPGFIGVCDALSRRGNRSRSWSDRKGKRDREQCMNNLRLEAIPCGEGVSCAQMRAYDMMEDTGASVVTRGLKRGVRGIADKIHHKERSLLEGAARRRGAVQGHGILEASADAVRQHKATSPDVYADNWGDMFTLGKLLQLAGADLDLDHNMDGWTTRQAGTAIEVLAVYNNLYPVLSTFGYRVVQYHYEVNELMLPYVNKVRMIEGDNAPDNVRRYEISYGVLVHFKVAGSFGFFNMVYLILMLTAAFALTSTASTVTDMYFMYVSDQRDNFFHLKYEVSPDFSDMWRCPTCGFHNYEKADTCQGVPRWMCPETTPKCGTHRPPGAEGGTGAGEAAEPGAALPAGGP